MEASSFELAVVKSIVQDRVTNTAHVWAGWGKQVVVTDPAAIAVEDNDALDNEIEIKDLN